MILTRSYKAPLPLIASFAVLIVCAAAAMWFSWQQRTADDWVRHTLIVENRLSGVQVLTTRAEINRRGYLLTGSAENRAVYAQTRQAVVPLLDRLVAEVADNPPQQARARLLRTLIGAKLDEMERSIALYADGRRAEAVAIVASDASRLRTKRLLDLVAEIRGEEAELLDARTARSNQFERYAAATLGLGALLIAILALVVGQERRRRLIALAEVNAALERDIVVRQALERDLDAARVRAENAVRAKSNFLANMSHEIRTPMNGVIGFTELLLAGELPEEQRRQVELIADSGRAMMRLLNDILDLSKVEAGQMTVASEPFDLRHTLAACAKLMAPAIEQRGIAFRRDVAADLPRIMVGDGLRLRQIVLNLLGNASKFTAEGEIRLDARPAVHGGRTVIAITVEDTGIGVAAEHQAGIFDHFVQADSSIASRFGGTGLGLPISAQLARLMGGSLTMNSQLGRGSRFTLVVPLRVPVAPELAAPPLPAAAPEATPRDATDTPIRLLVAEDHDVNQLLIMAMLEPLGIRADLAHDGKQAVEMVVAAAAAADPYALVLMDMQMPGTDGCEASRQLRAQGFGPGTLPILALTANAYADDIATCLNAGMQAHLAKPIRSADLTAAIRRWAARPVPAARPEAGERFSPQLRERYRSRRDELLDMLDQAALAGRVSDDEVGRITGALHKFAGSAAMFGDRAMGDQARLLERALDGCGRADRPVRVREAVDAMRAAG